MKHHHIAVRISFYTAVISFLTAATIFLLYFFSGDLTYAFMGYFAALILGLINLVVLVVLGVVMSRNAGIRRIGSTTMLFQMFNIPVAIACFWAGARLANIARITFVNETGSKLEQVKVLGCEEQVIGSIEPGCEESVWIRIKGDCSVRMEYVLNDSTINQEVCGYLCTGMGMPYTYNIGGKNATAAEVGPAWD
jgi:hypothetical protein